MRTLEADFQRSQVTRKITMVIMLVGVLASLVMFWPGMIGLNEAYRHPTTLFAFVPLVAAAVLATVIRWARR